jgi:hypothetical protein
LLSVTVPVELLPPTTEVGFMATEDRPTVEVAELKFTPVTLLPLTVTLRLDGVKANPALLGVTV